MYSNDCMCEYHFYVIWNNLRDKIKCYKNATLEIKQWDWSKTGLENVLAVFISSALDLHGGCKTFNWPLNGRCASVPFSRHKDLCIGCLLPGIFQINSQFQRKVPVVCHCAKQYTCIHLCKELFIPSFSFIHWMGSYLIDPSFSSISMYSCKQHFLPD